MSVTTPEQYQELISKGAASAELKKPLEIPLVNNEPGRYKYCSDDGECGHSDEAGCRRSETMKLWEQETGIDLPAELTWGARDLFFYFDNHIYYFKKFLQQLLDEDATIRSQDLQDPEIQSWLTSSQTALPDFNSVFIRSIDDIRTLISSNSPGLPEFVSETDNFFKFKSPGENLISKDNVDKNLLIRINNTFIGEWAFPMFPPTDSLVDYEGKIYWVDLLRWEKITSPILRSGISMKEGTTHNFYTAKSLSFEEKNLIKSIGSFYVNFQNESFVIIDL